MDVAHLGYYDPQVWTFVDYGHVGRRDYQRYAVRVGDVGDDLNKAAGDLLKGVLGGGGGGE